MTLQCFTGVIITLLVSPTWRVWQAGPRVPGPGSVSRCAWCSSWFSRTPCHGPPPAPGGPWSCHCISSGTPGTWSPSRVSCCHDFTKDDLDSDVTIKRPPVCSRDNCHMCHMSLTVAFHRVCYCFELRIMSPVWCWIRHRLSSSLISLVGARPRAPVLAACAGQVAAKVGSSGKYSGVNVDNSPVITHYSYSADWMEWRQKCSVTVLSQHELLSSLWRWWPSAGIKCSHSNQIITVLTHTHTLAQKIEVIMSHFHGAIWAIGAKQ